MAFGMLEDSFFSVESGDDYSPVLLRFANWCHLPENVCLLSPEHHPMVSPGTIASSLLDFYSSVLCSAYDELLKYLRCGVTA